MSIIFPPAGRGKGSAVDGGAGRRPNWVDNFLHSCRTVRPSDYDIRHADELTPGTRVWLLARESTEKQKADGNLDDQVRHLREEAERRGWAVVGVTSYVSNSLNTHRMVPTVRAARAAGAAVVAETMCRYRRPESFDSKTNFHAPLTAADMERFRQHVGPGPLHTLEDPDAPPHDNRGVQSSRGMETSGHMGGRGNKVTERQRQEEKREETLPEVRRLRAAGMSLGKIAVATGVPKATIQTWLNRPES
jgi:hypothetical protein